MASSSNGDEVTASTETRQQTLTSPSSNQHILHAPPLPTLLDELIEEILQWLPVKYLLQLRCICKSWKSLISSPQFAKKQLRRSPMATRLILSFMNPSREFILRSCPLPSVFNTGVTINATEHTYRLGNQNGFDWIVVSCDGILCFPVHQLAGRLVLWNPSIGEFKILPPLDNQRREHSYATYGFGYDSFTDRYKVVAILWYKCDDGHKTEVKVLMLGTDTWMMIQNSPSVFPLQYEPGKFVSGSINWLISKAEDSDSWVIISFDLRKESFEEVLQPDYGEVDAKGRSLCVSRDCLCMLYHTDLFFDVWLMNDYGNKESWTKLFRVPYDHNVGPYPYSKAISIFEDDQILLEWESEFAVYNSRNDTVKYLEIQNSNDSITSEVYDESLISPCS